MLHKNIPTIEKKEMKEKNKDMMHRKKQDVYLVISITLNMNY